MNPLKLVSLHRRRSNPHVWTPSFRAELEKRGSYVFHEDTDSWPESRRAEMIASADVLLTAWDAPPVPLALLATPGCLRYICHVNGELRRLVAREFVERGWLISNWGPAPAARVAEGAFALLLASLKLIPEHLRAKLPGGPWSLDCANWSGTMRGLHVGVYGMGVIGRAFVELAAGFDPVLSGFDPYAAEWPEGVRRVDNLRALFAENDAIIVAAGLNEETRLSVNAEMLALLPDGGILVNVARGGLVEQDALFAELERHRLRAALDVLDTDGCDWLPPDHPARTLPHLILTGHSVAGSSWTTAVRGTKDYLSEAHSICLANLDRFARGEAPLHTFDLDRYDRST